MNHAWEFGVPLRVDGERFKREDFLGRLFGFMLVGSLEGVESYLTRLWGYTAHS